MIESLGNSSCDEQIAGALAFMGEPALYPLIDILSNTDEYPEKRAAASALGSLGDSRAIDALVESLIDDDNYIRAKSAKALGDIGDSRANDALISALSDEDEFVRFNAATALGMIGNSDAVDPLIEVLEDDYVEYVRASSAEALG